MVSRQRVDRFVSLGDNCEFGFVQRTLDLDPGSLLRWAISPPDALAGLLESGFDGLYEFDNLQPWSDDMVLDAGSGFSFHSKLFSRATSSGRQFQASSAERQQIHVDELGKISYLKEKLLNELKSGQHIFVYKKNARLTYSQIQRLNKAIRKYNVDNFLLVAQQDSTCATPEVLRWEGNLITAKLERFAPYERADDVLFDAWIDIVQRAEALTLPSNLRQNRAPDAAVVVRQSSVDSPRAPQRDLIFDLGASGGEDTDFYLEKGFRVVSVDASLDLARQIAQNHAAEINAGSLTVHNLGIGVDKDHLPFYINKSNSHWNSFHENRGRRGDLGFEIIDVSIVNISELIEIHGLPYYLKMDIEGSEEGVLLTLSRNARPSFLSVAEYGCRTLDHLSALGYDAFALVPQRQKQPLDYFKIKWSAPETLRAFTGQDSGPFGIDLPQSWLPYEEARAFYLSEIRNENGAYQGQEHEWFDIHATNLSVLRQFTR